MTTQLFIERISARALRNLAHVDFTPGPRFNVISGDNGQGKTSLLEAIYLAATSRSFRTSRIIELIAHGESVASSKLVVQDEGKHEQSCRLFRSSRRRSAGSHRRQAPAGKASQHLP